MGLLNLFVAASMPVLKVLIVTAFGSFLALDSINLLGEDARMHLNSETWATFSSLLSQQFVKRKEPHLELLMSVVLMDWLMLHFQWRVVRISVEANLKEVQINDCSVSKSTSESSIAQPGSFTEPLLSPKDCVTSDEHAAALPYTRFDGKTQLAFTDKIKQHIAELTEKLNLKKLFAPSTNGAIVGFTVGLIPLFRKSMIGDTAPLRVIEEYTILLGEGAIPALTLIIGANLLKGLRASGIQKSMVVGIIVARYIALPLVGIVIVKGAVRFNLAQEDPLYQFVLLIQYAVPPAMNMGTITQLFGTGETECSVIMIWTYMLASVSLTLWCTFFMWLVA